MPLLSRGATDSYSSVPTMPKAIRVPFAKLLLVQVPFPTCVFFYIFLTVRFVTALPCVECVTKACTVCSQPQALVVAGKKLPWRDFNLLLAGVASVKSESESYW